MASETEGLKHLIPQLVARLQASDIIDQLYQNNLVTEAEYEGFFKDISQKSDFRDVNRRILMAVKKGPKGSVVKFEEILRASQPDLADELQRALFVTETTRAPKHLFRSVSSSATIATTPISEDMTMQHPHDDMSKPRPSSSVPDQPVQSSSDATAFSMSQPNPPMEKRVAELERKLEKAVSCVQELSLRIQELSSLMEQPSSPVMELSSLLRAHTAHMKEHTSRTAEHSSRMEIHTSQMEEHSSRMEEHSSRMEMHTSQMEGHFSRMEKHSSRIEEHSSRMETHTSQMEEHSSRMEKHSSCMEEHSSHTEEHSSRMEKHSSCTEEHSSQMEMHTSQMEEHSSRMKEHTAHMEEHTAHMKEHTANMEEQALPVEVTSSLWEHSSCMEEQSLLDDLSSKAQLEVKVFQTGPLLRDGPTMHSEKLPALPTKTACTTAVIIDRKVYVCGGRCDSADLGRQVYVCNLDDMIWSTLSEPALQYRCEAIVINNQLVFIGGREASSRKITNIVSTWTGQHWQQDIPAMPTKRIRPGVIMHGKYVIAAGGVSEHNRDLLSSIDILDTSMLQWWTPANFQLPQPMYALDITICSNHVYVAAAIIDYDLINNVKIPSNKAWQLPVSALEEVLTVKKNTSQQRNQWKEIAPTPNNHSTLLKYSIHPVAVGGAVKGDRSGCNSTRHISVYDPIHDRWSTVGRLLEQRARCAVVCITESTFLVCGGYSDTVTDPQPRLSSVELLSVHSK